LVEHLAVKLDMGAAAGDNTVNPGRFPDFARNVSQAAPGTDQYAVAAPPRPPDCVNVVLKRTAHIVVNYRSVNIKKNSPYLPPHSVFSIHQTPFFAYTSSVFTAGGEAQDDTYIMSTTDKIFFVSIGIKPCWARIWLTPSPMMQILGFFHRFRITVFCDFGNNIL
jgi:hypothetical protein